MRNDGTAAQDAFEKHWESRPETHIERLRDAKDLRGINGGRAVGDFPKPSDYIITTGGLTFYAEVKSTEKMNRFAFGDIRDYQKRTALLMASIGGVYNFYIYSYGRGQWYVMTARKFADAVAERRASITFEELEPWNLKIS